jgi:hypothetical protein
VKEPESSRIREAKKIDDFASKGHWQMQCCAIVGEARVASNKSNYWMGDFEIDVFCASEGAQMTANIQENQPQFESSTFQISIVRFILCFPSISSVDSASDGQHVTIGF